MPLATYCCPILAMLPLLPVLETYGAKNMMTVFAVAAAGGLLLAADKEIAVLFLFLGYYPALRQRINALRGRGLRLVLKLAVCNGALAAAYGTMVFLFRLEAVAQELAGTARPLLLALLAAGNAVFLLMDRALGQLGAFYRRRIRRG